MVHCELLGIFVAYCFWLPMTEYFNVMPNFLSWESCLDLNLLPYFYLLHIAIIADLSPEGSPMCFNHLPISDLSNMLFSVGDFFDIQNQINQSMIKI